MIFKSFFKLAAIAYVLVSVSSIEQVAAGNVITKLSESSPPDHIVDRIIESPQPNSEDINILFEYVKASPMEFKEDMKGSPWRFKDDRAMSKIIMFMLRENEASPEDRAIIKKFRNYMIGNYKRVKRFSAIDRISEVMKSILKSIRANDTMMETNPQSMQTNHMYFLLILLRCCIH